MSSTACLGILITRRLLKIADMTIFHKHLKWERAVVTHRPTTLTPKPMIVRSKVPVVILSQSALKIQMKVEIRDMRRDGAVYVDLDPQTNPNDLDLTWLEKAGEIACLVGLVALGLLAMAVF